jgi:non-ribosomal peptide synthetase component E (peptide arylation enzyme)
LLTDKSCLLHRIPVVQMPLPPIRIDGPIALQKPLVSNHESGQVQRHDHFWGENVYSAEVENIVAQHPAVAQCAVIGIPNETWGEQVHAIVMRRPGTKVDPVDIIAFCKERIAHYKCPRSVEIRDELPMSGPGKILKRELRAPFWEVRKRQVS